MTKHLPGSSRAALLFGLSLEAKGRRPDAKRWYEGTLEQDENDDVRTTLLSLSLWSSADSTMYEPHRPAASAYLCSSSLRVMTLAP